MMDFEESTGHNPRPRTEIESEFPPVVCGDQLHYRHGSEATVICLSPAHPILKSNSKVKAVRFNKTHLKGNKNHRVVAGEKICEIETEDGTVHVMKYDRDGLLLEANLKLLKNPSFVDRAASYEGYLAIVRYSPASYGNFGYVNLKSLT